MCSHYAICQSFVDDKCNNLTRSERCDTGTSAKSNSVNDAIISHKNNHDTSRDFTAPRYFASLFNNSNKIMAALRPLAYVSEVGESFRSKIPSFAVKGAYALSIGYVGVDTIVHTINVNSKLLHNPDITIEERQKRVAINFADKAVWHTCASMVLPALTIHTIVKYSNKGFLYGLPKMMPSIKNLVPKSSWAAVFVGLGSIPFIIHPLDHLTDYVMDNTVRKLYCEHLE